MPDSIVKKQNKVDQFKSDYHIFLSFGLKKGKQIRYASSFNSPDYQAERPFVSHIYPKRFLTTCHPQGDVKDKDIIRMFKSIFLNICYGKFPESE